MKYIKKIIFNANEFNIDLNYAKLDTFNEFTNAQRINKTGVSLILTNPDLNLNEPPETETKAQIWFQDKDLNGLGVLQLIAFKENYINLNLMQTVLNDDNTLKNEWKGFTIKQDLNTHEFTITVSQEPKLNSDSYEITSTAWVRKLLRSLGLNA